MQMRLAQKLVTMVGYDFERGRIDLTVHPFVRGVPNDVRITTRFDEADPIAGIMATMHESGHALYEQGLPERYAFQPVGAARGMGLHESQSLMIERQAARSASFLRVLAQLLRETFDGQGEAWSDENVRRLCHRVRPGHIRVAADEVTYPLHVVLRYRIERGLIDGSLETSDIPDAWSTLSQELLGIRPPDDRSGCLQDIHWAIGLFGYFPSYTFGAVAAAQIFETAKQEDAKIPVAIENGDFSPLASWANTNIYSKGSIHPTSQALLQEVTGSKLSADCFKSHLLDRYLEAS